MSTWVNKDSGEIISQGSIFTVFNLNMPLNTIHSQKDTADIRSLIFISFIAFLLLHHFFAFLGFYGMDDINYARHAAKLASGKPLLVNTADHFELRWVTIYVTAFFYRIMGINDYSSCAFGISTIILAGYFIKKILTPVPVLHYLLTLVLFFLNYQVLFATHRIWADTGICLFGFAAFYYYLQSRQGNNQVALALSCSVCFFLLLITKETAILFMPLIVFLFVRDIVKGQLLKFWPFAMLFSTILLVAYLAIFKVQTGDWWYRYHLLRSNSSGGCNFDQLPSIETIKRIGYALWLAFLMDGGLLFLIFGFCGYLYRVSVMPEEKYHQIAIAFFILLLSANFMSISSNSYVPLCQDTRHFLFIFPFSAICGSFMLQAYFNNPFKFWLLPALVGVATVLIFLLNGGEMKYIYLLICLVLLLPMIDRNKTGLFKNKMVFPAIILACFLIRPMYDLVYEKRGYYYDHKKLILSISPGISRPSVIFTGDDLTAELSEYFLAFNTGPIRFKNVGRTDQFPRSLKEDTYFLVNNNYNPRLRDILSRFQTIDNKPALLLKKRVGGTVLYKVNYLPVLDSLKQYVNFKL